MDTPFFAVFHFMIEKGLRIGEVLALTWEDIDLTAGLVSVTKTTTCYDKLVGPTKTSMTRTVDLSQDVVHTTKEWALRSGRPQDGGLVFPFGSTHRITRRVIGTAMFKGLKQAGLPVHFTPHCLRHTFASILLSDGTPITYVQRQLGHASIQETVDTYGSWIPHTTRYVDGLRLRETVTTATKTA